jgi:lysozyme family protein
MSVDWFSKCHAVTAVWEGGWSDHKADPGGKTMYGVTEAVFHAWLRKNKQPIRPVRSIKMPEALAIYKEEYWHKAKCDTLAPGVNLAVYDAAVNSGVGRGRNWLLASVCGTDVQTVKNICRRRLSFVQGLRTWSVFGKGWGRRIADIEAKGVAWAMAAAPATTPKVAKKRVEAEAVQAEDLSKKQKTGAGGAGAAGGGGAVATTDPADWAMLDTVVVLGFAGVTIAFVVWLLWRARVNKARAEAYKMEAAKL